MKEMVIVPKGYSKIELQNLYQSLIGSRQGHLTVLRPATKEENQSQPGNSKWWLCQCDCGKQIFVKTAYLQGNAGRGDYKINSCGCGRTVRHFLANAKILSDEDEEWLYDFYKQDWEKFSLLHSCIVKTSGIKSEDWENKEKYKQFYEHWWKDFQFNLIYDNWKKQKNSDIINNTFYDWWKPSLDHIIPKSRGGTNDINNLQFLTVFENLAKRDMTQEEWNNFKVITNTSSDLFVENIKEVELK